MTNGDAHQPPPKTGATTATGQPEANPQGEANTTPADGAENASASVTASAETPRDESQGSGSTSVSDTAATSTVDTSVVVADVSAPLDVQSVDIAASAPATEVSADVLATPQPSPTGCEEALATTSESTADVRPHERIRIGSQRNAPGGAAPGKKQDSGRRSSRRRGGRNRKPKAGKKPGEGKASGAGQQPATASEAAPPPAPSAAPATLSPGSGARPQKVPKPTRQSAHEVDQEIEAALAGVSLDQMMDAGAAVAGQAELPPETRLEGQIAAVHQDHVFVELGGRHQGVVPMKQFAEPPEIGAKIDAIVQRFNADDGLYELNRLDAAAAVGDWSQVAEGMLVEAVVTGHNKGGLEVDVSKLQGFVPASQVAMYRIEDLSQCVGEKWTCLVTEVKPRRRRLILSRRAVLEREREEQRKKLREELAPGQIREGTVRSITDFGAFIDLGGIDGLVHISQLSWAHVKHASEVLEVGQPVKVKVLKVDPASGKIALGMKELIENPWDQAEQKYPAGSKAKGCVTRLADFGAFVQLEAGVEGLVHISELAHHRVFRTSDVLEEGQELEVQVLSVDRQAQRIGLSLKALTPKPVSAKKTPAAADTPPEPAKKKRKASDRNLRGGIGGASGGDKFGLNW